MIHAHPVTVSVDGCDADNRRLDVEGLEVAADRDALLDADIDALFVCTPNRVAPEVVVAALDAGKHVSCEKPPGRTLEGIQAMMKAEARNPVPAMKTGFNHRYHLGIMKAIVDSQRYGPVLWAQRQSGDSDSRNDPDAAGGGILLDQGIHMLDLLRYFLGDFVEFKSMSTTSFGDSPLEDNAFAFLRAGSGCVATAHSLSGGSYFAAALYAPATLGDTTMRAPRRCRRVVSG